MRATYMKAPRLGGCGCSGSKLGGCGCSGKSMRGYASGCGYGSGCGYSGARSPRRYALAAFGLFGAFDAKYEVIDGIGFNEAWTNNDFNGGKWAEHIKYWFKLSYTPLANNFLVNANNKMLAFKSAGEMGSQQAYNQYETYRQQLSSLCDQADKLTKTADFTGAYSDSVHKQRYANFNAIQALVKQISFANVPQPPVQEAPPVQSSPPAQTQQQSPPKPVYTNYPAQSEPPPQANNQPPPSTNQQQAAAPPAKKGMPLGIILPIGGAVVVGALLLLLPKKKGGGAAPAVAGYRGRRRR